MQTALDELVSRLGVMPREKYEEVSKKAQEIRQSIPWVPNPGPQTIAYLSKADLTLFGGRAGGGKSQLLLGWGVNDAENGIIFRRELTQTDGLETEGKKIISSSARWNGQDHEWTWGSGKSLKLAGMREQDSWMDHAGRERDFIGYDEAGEFLEQQVSSMLAWLRSEGGKRTRMILASNPPRTAEGSWMIEWFAPWLDETYHNPAKTGEIRWAIYVSKPDGTGQTVWVEGPGEYEIEGEKYTAMSRTFIPASLEDNPYRNSPEYRAKLQSLPEPLRSQLLKGDFTAGLDDAANQCIPTAWIRAAQKRWTEKHPNVPMCSMGVDCSGGGKDPLVISPRYDGWFMRPIVVEGSKVPIDNIGPFTAGVIITHRKDNCLVTLDMGGGYGGSTHDHLKQNGVEVYPYKGAEKSTRRTADKKLGFTNTRSAAYWGFREALDPGQPGGSPIALPDDPVLVADLASPTFEITPNGIKVEPKEKVTDRLGRSTNHGDAVVMAWYAGPKEKNSAIQWADARMSHNRPKVVMHRKRRLMSHG